MEQEIKRIRYPKVFVLLKAGKNCIFEKEMTRKMIPSCCSPKTDLFKPLQNWHFSSNFDTCP